jgi:hypothetical protein
MQLRFYARDDLLVHERNHDGSAMPRPSNGAPARYVGRQHDATTRGYPATQEPYVCPSENAGEAAYLAARCRDNELWPADEATAAAIGVKFVHVHFHDGVWAPRASHKHAKES